MIVFCDFHHGGLYRAMHMLFHDRLGWELYRPIGYEWVNRGFWHVSTLKPTQKAYLDPEDKSHMGEDGYWRWYDGGEELEHKCMTFDQFLETTPDIIVSTFPGHELPYANLASKYAPKAKLIQVCGNVGEIRRNVIPNLMDSTGLYREGAANYVHFHQEFPLAPFVWREPPEKRIRQYLNFVHDSPEYPRWVDYQRQMPDFDWREHGHQGRNGFVTPLAKIAESMIDSTFVWHVKWEGYGHVAHNAYAAGRPIITDRARYAGKTLGALLEDGETCIDLGLRGVDDNVWRIRRLSEPEEAHRLAANAWARFRQVVDFDEEEGAVRKFLGRLL